MAAERKETSPATGRRGVDEFVGLANSYSSVSMWICLGCKPTRALQEKRMKEREAVAAQLLQETLSQ